MAEVPQLRDLSPTAQRADAGGGLVGAGLGLGFANMFANSEARRRARRIAQKQQSA